MERLLKLREGIQYVADTEAARDGGNLYSILALLAEEAGEIHGALAPFLPGGRA
jgi:hypothetical protein